MNQKLLFGGYALLILILVSCREENSQAAFQADSAVYWELIRSGQNDPLAENEAMIQFWSNRISKDSTGVGELGPLGAAYEARFQLKGNYQDLDRALTLYKLGVHYSAHHKDQFVRHMARVLITQHRFDQAYKSLDSLLTAGGQNRQTRLQLFDAAMEVAQYKVADSLLVVLDDATDFNYLIRAAKWNDHKGDLDTAIVYMEKAMKLAEARQSKPLLEWVYSNLATFYGHAGRLQDSYQLILKTLAINPRHVQSIKQLAWLEYAAAGDPKAAIQLYDYLGEVYKGLDVLLLKAEALELTDQNEAAATLRERFVEEVLAKGLSQLYANDLIQLWSQSENTLQTLAWEQYKQRPTKIQAALLAYTLQQAGDTKGATDLIELHDLSFAHEPLAKYFALKALHGMGTPLDRAVLNPLIEAQFELGPVKAAEVTAW